MASTSEDNTKQQGEGEAVVTEDEEQQYSCLYFGFASNLSPRTMKQRCPGALYIGLAALKGWKFIISKVGFGNIVPTNEEEDVVYGSLHFLTRRDEAALDKSEEVPDWHVKKHFKVKRVPVAGEGSDWSSLGSQELEVMTYVDVVRTTEGVISKEYLVWMRKAIEDGARIGVPQTYFDKYFQKFLPEDDDVGREEKIIMIRTTQMDKTDLGYVPMDVRKMTGKSDS